MRVRNLLIVFGLVIIAYTVYFMNASMVLYSGDPELVEQYWLSKGTLKWLFGLGFVVFALHLIVTIWAIAKKHILWSTAIPVYFMPYMIGAIVQALIL